MSESKNPNRVFRFGLYELDGITGELRKDGKARPRVQGQPLEVPIPCRSGYTMLPEELNTPEKSAEFAKRNKEAAAPAKA